ncbi:MAG: hypothetical protein H6667_23280 [Ardenticatenaceae bacterium]|nr:hypothetical protein [Ardenticatenaceae bacterium]MCB9445597.1 hypothetical protein [Ardenticatenaceae bacterium]
MTNTKTEKLIAESISLLNKSGFKAIADVANAADLVGETAVVYPLHVGEMLVAYYIGARQSTEDIEQKNLIVLKSKMLEAFNDNDLKNLCFELNIHYEDLGEDTRDGRIRSLIEFAQRNGRLAGVTSYCRHNRNHIIWPNFPDLQEVVMQPQDDLAVIVAINQLTAFKSAADYLAAQNISCNYLLLTTSAAYDQPVWLPENQKWGPAVVDFHRAMQKTQTAKRHFFFAAPLPYVFAIGTSWALVSTGDELYHWDGKEYVHVMTTAREWRGR